MNELNSLSCELSGLNLIEAAAGTGKTYNIQNLVVRLLLEKNIPIESIAVVTFTEAAADELKSRLRSVIDSCCSAALGKSSDKRSADLIEAAEKYISREEAVKILSAAKLDFDKANVGTIHGFCQRLLKDFAFESGEDFETELLSDASDIRNSFVTDAYRRFCYYGEYSPFYSRILNINALKELVKQKSDRSDLIILPAAPETVTLEEASRKLAEKWFEFKNFNQIASEVEALNGLVSGTKIKKPEETLQSIQTVRYPTAANIEKLQKYCPENLILCFNKNKQQALENVVSQSKLFPLIGELCLHWEETRLLLRDSSIRYSLERFEEFKKKNGWITFNDMLKRAGKALENKSFVENIRAKLKVGIIDEFQDTDPIQWQIFYRLFSESTLFLVGDPRQAIYSFRGGDIATYLDARDHVPENKRYTLTTNYRSCDQLLEQVNIWFSGHHNGFAANDIRLPLITAPEKAEDKTFPLLIDGKTDDKPLKIIECSKEDNYRMTAQIICDLLTVKKVVIPGKGDKPERPLKPDDIAVLGNKWAELREIKKELTELNIPAVILKSGNVFSSRSGKELQKVLNALLNTSDSSIVRTALLTSVCGMQWEDLTVDKDISSSIAKLAELKKIWEEKSFNAMFSKLLIDFDTEVRFAGEPDGMRHITDLIQIGDILHHEASSRQLAPQALYEHLMYCCSLPDDSEIYPAEQEADRGAVILCSEHKSKGLQYPVVILPSLNTGKKDLPAIFHRPGDTALYTGERTQQDTTARNDEFLQEKLRLAYVAITRAENACFITATPVNTNSRTPNFRLTALNWLWTHRDEEKNASPSETLFNSAPDDRELPDFDDPPQTGCIYAPEKDTTQLTVKQLEHKIPVPLHTTSFTGLSPAPSGAPFVPPAPDGKEDDETEQDPPPDTDKNKTDPLRRLRGNTFGLLLHGIMEYLDFKASDETIREKVEQEILLSEPTEEELAYSTSVISNTLKTQLMDDFRISDIRPEKRCTEMKFHFGFASELKKEKICSFAAEYMGEKYEKKQDDHLYNGGFVTGSIDLLFEHEGKYYILDWKSNLLQDYKQDTLKGSMAHSFYQMQYLIYLTALMRFLKQRLGLPEFGEAEYDKYIGGAYYIYMRGAGADPDDPRNGVYFDRPAYSQIQKVAGLLK